jgi:uncharacterized protein YukE
MVSARGSGDDLRVNQQDLRQAAQHLAGLSAAVRGLVAEVPAACSAAASACPGWRIGVASSAAETRWENAVRTHAAAVAGAGDSLAASAATFETAEDTLVRRISAVSRPAEALAAHA